MGEAAAGVASAENLKSRQSKDAPHPEGWGWARMRERLPLMLVGLVSTRRASKQKQASARAASPSAGNQLYSDAAALGAAMDKHAPSAPGGAEKALVMLMAVAAAAR